MTTNALGTQEHGGVAGVPVQVPVTFVEIGLIIAAAPGSTLQQLGDLHRTPLVFGCRAARCGACLIRIVDGAHNLDPVRAAEQRLLEILEVDDSHRLACQCTVRGAVTIVTAH